MTGIKRVTTMIFAFPAILSLTMVSCTLTPEPVPQPFTPTPRSALAFKFKETVMWQLEIRDANGNNPVIKTLSDPIGEVPRMVVGVNGDCFDATMINRPADLGIEYRDIVTVQSVNPGNGQAVNRWAGYALPGNVEHFEAVESKLAGLRSRLYEVELRRAADNFTGTRDIAVTIRDWVQETIASGQLGNAVIFDAALVPDIGVNVPEAVFTFFPSLGDALDELTKLAPGLKWGVNADRKFWASIPTGTITIDEDVTGTIIEDITSPRDRFTSAVRWLLGTSSLTEIATAVRGSANEQVQTLSTQVNPLGGFSVERVEIKTPSLAFEPATQPSANVFVVAGGSLVSGNLNDLLSPSNTNPVVVSTSATPSGEFSVMLRIFGLKGDDAVGVAVKSANELRVSQLSYREVQPIGSLLHLYQDFLTRKLYSEKFATHQPRNLIAGADVLVTLTMKTAGDVSLTRLYPIKVNKTLLDNAAQSFYRTPSVRSGTGRIPEFPTSYPATAAITRRNPDGSVRSAYSVPVSSYELRITDDDFLDAEVVYGDPNDPVEIQRMELLRALTMNAKDGTMRYLTGGAN
ncbi:MAG: hypothetical protein HC933_06430 [Pleurocapsa sp. SU_196_0]|nr:hypothetical protein [Pleurocapsa sp. SU_196_0]